jgi:hypothetical protein
LFISALAKTNTKPVFDFDFKHFDRIYKVG